MHEPSFYHDGISDLCQDGIDTSLCSAIVLGSGINEIHLILYWLTTLFMWHMEPYSNIL